MEYRAYLAVTAVFVSAYGLTMMLADQSPLYLVAAPAIGLTFAVIAYQSRRPVARASWEQRAWFAGAAGSAVLIFAALEVFGDQTALTHFSAAVAGGSGAVMLFGLGRIALASRV